MHKRWARPKHKNTLAYQLDHSWRQKGFGDFRSRSFSRSHFFYVQVRPCVKKPVEM